MEMLIDFPGGARVDAHFSGYTVPTDQPPAGGGEGSAPTPFAVFLSTIGTCAGIYVLGFCRSRNIPAEGIRIIERPYFNHATGLADSIDIEIQVPPEFPQKYLNALILSAEQCKVKQQIANPPTFNIAAKALS